MAFKLKAHKAVSNGAIIKEGFEALLEIIEAEQGLACKAFVDHSFNAISGNQELEDTFRERMKLIVQAKRVSKGQAVDAPIHPELESERLQRMAREAMA